MPTFTTVDKSEASPLKVYEDFVIRHEEGCWGWAGGISDDYPYFLFAEQRILAHRFSFETFVEPLKFGNKVCHSCDNPPCTRPDHLWQGSSADNSADMQKKGRAASGDKNGARLYPERMTRGENHHSARFTPQVVLDIRDLYAQGYTISELTKCYGVALNTIWQIVHRKTWKHI